MHFNKYLTTLLFLFFILALNSSVFGQSPVITGDIEDYYINTLIKQITLRRSGLYRPPDKSEREQFSGIINLLKNANIHNLTKASENAQSLGYEIIIFRQSGQTESEYYILKEKISLPGRNVKGWGSYVINKNPGQNIIIEAPYPLNHMNTGMLAVTAFKYLNARALLLPGAHRYASSEKAKGIYVSDAGLTGNTIFNTVHRAFSETTVIQFQGFSRSVNPNRRKTYPPIILADGFANDVERAKNEYHFHLLRTLQDNLNDEAIVLPDRSLKSDNISYAGLFGEKGIHESALKGSDNIQGQYIHSLPSEKDNSFVIFYLDKKIRLAGSKIFLQILNALNKSLKDIKRIPAAVSQPEHRDTAIQPEETEPEAPAAVVEAAASDQNLIKDITLLTTIFIVITLSLGAIIIFLVTALLKSKQEKNALEKRIKRIESYHENLENEVKDSREISTSAELKLESEKAEKEAAMKEMEKIKKDKEYFYKGYNRQVKEKWELEKKLKRIEAELNSPQYQSSLEGEYYKLKEKGIPASFSRLVKTYDELLDCNSRLKDTLRCNKLLSFISDEKNEDRLSYILIAGELKLKSVSDKLLETASDESVEQVCAVSIWALGEMAGQSAGQNLLKIINNESKIIYQYSNHVLKKIGFALKGESAPPTEEISLLSEKDEIYKYAGFESKEHFINYILKFSDEDIKILTIKVLEKFGITKNLTRLIQFTESPLPDVRYESARVLGNAQFVKNSRLLMDIDRKNKILDALQNLLKSESSIYVQRRAVKSLEQLTDK